MFDHVAIRVADPLASRRFYQTTLSAIGVEPSGSDGEKIEWGDFKPKKPPKSAGGAG